MLEKTEGSIKNGPSRDTGNIGHMTQDEDKQNKKHFPYKNDVRFIFIISCLQGVHILFMLFLFVWV
jgi:hypothetical protein